MLGIAVGWIASNAAEWLIHKHILHGLGKRKQSFWSFHWHEHHRASRRNGFIDDDYHRGLFGWHAQTKEALGLVGLGVAVTPLLRAFPFFVGTVYACGLNYYRVHRRAHLDPDWAREHLAWHYDHHMGPDQHANWCVTHPFFDHVMGTRKPYVGTEREADDVARREAFLRRRAAAAA
ncbi:MAG: hypothetical protein AAGA56_16225 [Myxococcota bacterium]